MTENDAIEELKFNNEKCLEQCEGACFSRKNNDCACQDAVIERMLDELLQYREIGTVEECREAVEKLKRAEEALNVILSGNYNDECNFCVHNDNPMANCQCICGDGSWCIHNAKWNGKTSEDENLEGMEDENT